MIDGYLSADGPFGIFADPRPNLTKAVIVKGLDSNSYFGNLMYSAAAQMD